MITQTNCVALVRSEILRARNMEFRVSFVWEVTPCTLADRIYYPEIGGGSPPKTLVPIYCVASEKKVMYHFQVYGRTQTLQCI
jgi:hypothetical protein